ncbi:MAG: hypothetical protein V5A68_06875 [Candidatus Thermoplasmatota archaeon]
MGEKSTDSMNEELKKWLKENPKTDLKKDIKKHQEKKPWGKCQICGEKKAKHVCIKCGKSVCKTCYFKIIGVCKECVPKETAAKWEGKQPDWEQILGVEWVD